MVVSPEREDEHLTIIPGCLCRLRMFSPAWQASHGIEPGDRIVCMDLDTVITGALDPLFDRPEPFVIIQGANTSNPCPYLGAMMMLRAGEYPEVWSDFSYEAVNKIASFEFPDDQGWLADKIPNAAGWQVGTDTGVYAFGKNGWPKGTFLPPGARLVTFPGWRDPSTFAHLDWVKRHWSGDG